MRYGLNFGGPDLEEKAKELKLPVVWTVSGRKYYLKGIADSLVEAQMMRIEADNGKRWIRIRAATRYLDWWNGVYID